MTRAVPCRRPGCEQPAHPLDPYCSSDCCRAHHGLITLQELEQTRERVERRIAGQTPRQFSEKPVRVNVANARLQGAATWDTAT